MHRTPRGGALAGARESLCAPTSSGSVLLCLSFSTYSRSLLLSFRFSIQFPFPLSLPLPRNHPPSWIPDCGATDTHPVSVYFSLVWWAKGLREREGSRGKGKRVRVRGGERERENECGREEPSLHAMGMGNGTPRNIGGH